MQLQKDVKSELNEVVDWRSTLNKWWLDNCKCSILLTYNYSQWYVVSNMFKTCYVGDKVGNHSDGSINQGSGQKETWTWNLLNPEDQWVSSAVVMVLFHTPH